METPEAQAARDRRARMTAFRLYDLRDEVNEFAKREHISVGEAVRTLITWGLEQRGDTA